MKTASQNRGFPSEMEQILEQKRKQHSKPSVIFYNQKPFDLCYSGGSERIRTSETRKRPHDFESCAFNHSATLPSPIIPYFSRKSSLSSSTPPPQYSYHWLMSVVEQHIFIPESLAIQEVMATFGLAPLSLMLTLTIQVLALQLLIFRVAKTVGSVSPSAGSTNRIQLVNSVQVQPYFNRGGVQGYNP